MLLCLFIIVIMDCFVGRWLSNEDYIYIYIFPCQQIRCSVTLSD